MAPLPYWMEKAEPFALNVEDWAESYFACRKHAMDEHCTLGTQRLLDLSYAQCE